MIARNGKIFPAFVIPITIQMSKQWMGFYPIRSNIDMHGARWLKVESAHAEFLSVTVTAILI